MINRFLLILGLFVGVLANAQEGTIKGKVYDEEVNDVLPFANVTLKGTTIGSTTDFDGNYALNVEPGTYTVVFSFVGYQTKEVTEVVVEDGKDVVVNISLAASAASLDEVIITTTARENTEASVLNLQKKSVNVFDGLSIESVKKVGANDVASAVKNIPGVSVEGGKYVYVRGLGDRYTKSILNGMSLPGLDPDRNTIQLDIFPTNLLENIIVYKTLTADLPADFTGGAVDIVTKDFSSREEYNFNVGLSYNPDMHFNGDFLTQSGSNTDFLGFDDGLRDDPIAPGTDIPLPFNDDPQLTSFTQAFNPEMAAKTSNSNMNYNFGFSTSNQFDVGEDRLGYIGSISYRTEQTYYEDYTQNFLLKPEQLNEFEMIPNRLQQGRLSKESVLVSAMAGLTYKRDYAKYKLNMLHLQSGEARTGEFFQQTFISNGAEFFSDNLEYTQRSVSNLQLSGEHAFESNENWNLDWSTSAAYAVVADKDVRSTLFELEDDRLIIRPSIGDPRRIWRDLDEINLSAKTDLQNKHQLFDNEAKLKFGALTDYKQREFNINQYVIRFDGAPAEPLNGDPNQLLKDVNIWRVNNSGGSYIVNQFEPANNYDSYSTTFAGYVSEEFNVTDKLKAILGLRFEKFDIYYTGQDTQGSVELVDENIISEADLFPSANFIYSLNDDQNLRLTYSRSTARPSFKEASVAQIFDPITNITFNGNLELRPTYVNNLDVRYEIFGDDAQLIAVSGFYKDFTDPIELTVFGIEAINDIQPRNLGQAQVFGAEFEVRKNFGFIAESLKDLSINANVSIIESQQTMNEAEFQGRLSAARDGESIDNERELQGQSPFLINTGLTYDSDDKGIRTGLYYNVQGKTLQVVGIGAVPDVYTEPFHNLKFNFTKSFGEDNNSSITFRASNLLNDDRESFYESFGAEDRIYNKFSPGMNFSLSYSLKF
ncbi:TonB-dependent Receptor Plug Domain [Psychroflexus salarius]|uniref:TonB-dependent Receptor Plug Domain n=1 Tax=Psychroflexus salarius TaxID=1155689 RepID=A0A1M4WJQ8_9FLAO|nr:TonB-dependent receptor [Psychroflexus salarius]SHE81489.1 TonB-dependent Receptor Plug Domain [Psychroflexus salarius]